MNGFWILSALVCFAFLFHGLKKELQHNHEVTKAQLMIIAEEVGKISRQVRR